MIQSQYQSQRSDAYIRCKWAPLKLTFLYLDTYKLKDKLSVFHTTNVQWFYDLTPQDTTIHKGQGLQLYSIILWQF